MKEKDAELIIQQLNPVLKRARMIFHHLQLDRENEDIEICNMFGSVFARIHYPDHTILDALDRIMEEGIWMMY